MKKNMFWLLISCSCLVWMLTSILLDKPALEKPKPVMVSESGNHRIENFDQAKRILRKLYKERPYTFYCGCYFDEKGIDFASCGFKTYKDEKRARRIEWEHIVPASDFGRSFSSWRDGDPRCKDRQGKPYKGRSCAKLVSPQFNRMEADLYNLVPAVGEVNGMRKDYPMGLLPGLPNTFGRCKTKIANGVIEPREEVRGFIARTYKYMNDSYRGHGIISRKNEKLFEAWDKQYAPDKYEIERARRIAQIQGNTNIFVEGASKLAQGENKTERGGKP